MRIPFLLLTFLSLVSVNAANDALVCPTIGSTYKGRIDTRDPFQNFGEISGIALSPTQKAPSGEPLLFAASDGGSGERVGLWDPATGKRLLTLQIANTTVFNRDWEALVIGSCGNTGVNDSCLYVFDGGDNPARQNSGRLTGRWGIPYYIVKIREPKLEDFEDQDFLPESYISILEYNFDDPSQPTRFSDAELMFMDHVGWGQGESIGDLYIVTKWSGKRDNMYKYTRLVKFPADAWPDSYCASKTLGYSPKAVGYYDYKSRNRGGQTLVTDGQLIGREWRSGEMTFDGTLIGLGDVDMAFLFLRCPGQTVADVLAGPNASSVSCLQYPHVQSGQVEAFTWTPDGDRSLNIPEGHRPGIGRASMIYSTQRTTKACPGSLSLPPTPQLHLPTSETLEQCRTEAPTMTPMPTATPFPSPSPTNTSAPTFKGQTPLPTPRPTFRPTRGPILPSQTGTDAPSGVVIGMPTNANDTPPPSTNSLPTGTLGPTEVLGATSSTGNPTSTARAKVSSTLLHVVTAMVILHF